MTRYARCGSTQKHQKVPGDATPWEEMTSKFPDRKHPANRTRKRKKVSSSKESDTIASDLCSSASSDVKDAESTKDVQGVIKKIKKEEEKSDLSLPASSEVKDVESNENVSETVKNSNKKISYLEKQRMKSDKAGILLLPPNIERQLYNIKRKLHKQGAPGDVIKETIRKARRKEELKFRKVLTKPCFNCREIGHLFADCPAKSDVSVKQEARICLKCGSCDHTSFKCPKKIQGFPFAKCFLCKEQGHICRDCPINSHGVYPKGGRCYLCGNVNHLKKDCPSLHKNDDEEEISLLTLNDGTSADVEIVKSKVKSKSPANSKGPKKPKMVKF